MSINTSITSTSTAGTSSTAATYSTSPFSQFHDYKKAFFLSILGTIVEYYDYALYGFCAVILAQQFFPTTDPTVSLLKTYGVFFAGSFSKPLGALVFGFIGDSYGRSPALKISLLGIAIPTIVVGLLPSYKELGWVAPLILLLCRISQGIFVSGESDGVRIYILETFGKKYPCFANSLVGFACLLGIYLASIASTFNTIANAPLWMWRVPFIIGGLCGIVVVILRHSLKETPEFIYYLNKKYLDEKNQNHKIENLRNQINSKDYKQHDKGYKAFKDLWLRNWKSILAIILICGSAGGTYHFYLVFWNAYQSSVLQMIDNASAVANTSQAVLIFMLCLPLSGWFGDKYGALKVVKTSSYIVILLVVLNAYLISQGIIYFGLTLLISAGLAFIQGPSLILFYIPKFVVEERFRCFSLGHAMGSLLFSGSTPFVSLWIWKKTEIAMAPLIYFIFLMLLGLIAISTMMRNWSTAPINAHINDGG